MELLTLDSRILIGWIVLLLVVAGWRQDHVSEVRILHVVALLILVGAVLASNLATFAA